MSQHVSREVVTFAALQVRDVVEQAKRGTPAARRKFMRDAEVLFERFNLLFLTFQPWRYDTARFRRECGLPERKDPRRRRSEPR